MAKLITGSTKFKEPIRNFVLGGPTGGGKTTATACLAGILNMPYVVMSCNPESCTQDFLSTFVPNTASGTGKIPSINEIAYDPETAYETVTGVHKDDVTPDDVIAAISKLGSGSDTPRFKHVESQYVQALTNGWLVEIQESTCMKTPGVAKGLNQYDHKGAKIPLVDGSTRTRHENAIVIYTDNYGYIGAREMEESVLCRNVKRIFIEDLSESEMWRRTAYNTGSKNKALFSRIYKLFNEVKTYCSDNGIRGGDLSVVEIENAMKCIEILGEDSFLDNFIDCVVNKATSRKDEREEIVQFVLTKYQAA